MNWEDRINIPFKIETGDGQVFLPLWKGGEKEREFNTSTFEFINVYGTLVDRKQPMGAKYPLVFWFQGSDNILQADAFETACEDTRQWTVTHPFYGVIKGHPLSIRRDDSSLNITEITIPFWESISPDYPFSNFSRKDNTRDLHEKAKYSFSQSATDTVEYTPIDVAAQKELCIVIGSELESLQDNNTYADFQNSLNTALKAIDNLMEDPLNAIQTVQNFLDLPSLYEQAIKGRVATYESIYWRLKESLETLTDKKYYESIAGTVLSLISVTIINPLGGDYILIFDVEEMFNRLSVVYLDYLETLDLISDSNYSVGVSFSPDATAQNDLTNIINYSLANLQSLTFGTKIERSVVLTKDSNIILLVHKYLGLDDLDENLDIFKKTNNITFNENFILKKGREIKYIK